METKNTSLSDDNLFFSPRFTHLGQTTTACVCGNTLKNPTLTSTTACTATCPGNSAQICGSSSVDFYFSVFSQGKSW